MGMGIFDRLAAMSRPSCMRNTNMILKTGVKVKFALVQETAENIQPTGSFDNFGLRAIPVCNRVQNTIKYNIYSSKS